MKSKSSNEIRPQKYQSHTPLLDENFDSEGRRCITQEGEDEDLENLKNSNNSSKQAAMFKAVTLNNLQEKVE